MIKAFLQVIKSNRFLSLSGNLFGAGFAFLSIVILTRVMSKEDIGSWVLFLTFSSFFDMLRGGIIRVGLIRDMFVDEKKIIGSAWALGLMLSGGIALFSLGSYWLFPEFLEDHNYSLFGKYYYMLVLANLPYLFTFWIQQGRSGFGKIFASRLLQAAPFAGFVAYSYFYGITIDSLVLGYIGSYIFSSLVSLLLDWCNIKYVVHANFKKMKELFDFGKFTMGTALGTNLLKSADTFIINEMLGASATAMYNITYRIMELIEIPVRSLVATVLPKMAKASVDKNNNLVRLLFYENTGGTTLLLIPALLFIAMFADFLPPLLFGPKYAGTGDLLRIFCLFGVLLPLDRFIGISLDALGHPERNTRKIFAMVVANIVFDLIALSIYPAVEAAAVVTILTALVGIILGHRYLNEHIDVNYANIYTEGRKYIKRQLRELKK